MLPGVCHTRWCYSVCALQDDATRYVPYKMMLLGMCLTRWCYSICALQDDVTRYVPYKMMLFSMCHKVYVMLRSRCHTSWRCLVFHENCYTDRQDVKCNNNNEYLERLTRTGPKRLHVLYKYIFVKIQCKQHECTHTRTHTHRLAQARTRAHVNVSYVRQ